MLPSTESFTYEYDDSELVYGRESVDQLDEILAENGLESALVVCGSNVGSNEELMEPVRRGLGDRCSGVFDKTTPDKLAETVYDGLNRFDDSDADVLVGLGGGSSLDIARQMSAFAGDGRSLSELRDSAKRGDLEICQSDAEPIPVIIVPTTFAGADMSSGGSIEVLSTNESPTEEPVRIRGSVMPRAILYDPILFETTPQGALAGSAMNGFNKGIETIYAKDASPITDATAGRGLALLRSAFPDLGDGQEKAMDRAVVGIILVQFNRKGSIIHAFGHGFSRWYSVQQGVIHAIMAPHVLWYLFENVDGKRQYLADALGIETTMMTEVDIGNAVINAVTEIRDSLDLPTRLRDVDQVERDDFSEIAAYISEDYLLNRGPVAFDPTVSEIESVLENAW